MTLILINGMGGVKSLQPFAQSTAAMVIFLYPRKIKFNLE